MQAEGEHRVRVDADAAPAHMFVQMLAVPILRQIPQAFHRVQAGGARLLRSVLLLGVVLRAQPTFVFVVYGDFEGNLHVPDH